MDEEQQRKFEKWASGENFLKRFDGFSPTLTDLAMVAQDAWEACLESNKVEEQELEPSTTEMVKMLLEKGWKVHVSGSGSCWFESPRDAAIKSLDRAYREAFPPKKKVEIEVWLDSDGEVRIIPSNSDSKGLDPKRVSWGWTKGVATFWVEEQPCTSEDGSS